MQITREELVELLRYDGETGLFWWRIPLKGRAMNRPCGSTSGAGYCKIWIGGRHYRAHRLAWLYVHGDVPEFLDHINGDRADNRIENLRPATREQNNFNRSICSRNTSGLKGASFDRRRGCWIAQIRHRGIVRYLGAYDTAQEAHEAYVREAEKTFGEFAKAA